MVRNIIECTLNRTGEIQYLLNNDEILLAWFWRHWSGELLDLERKRDQLPGSAHVDFWRNTKCHLRSYCANDLKICKGSRFRHVYLLKKLYA